MQSLTFLSSLCSAAVNYRKEQSKVGNCGCTKLEHSGQLYLKFKASCERQVYYSDVQQPAYLFIYQESQIYSFVLVVCLSYLVILNHQTGSAQNTVKQKVRFHSVSVLKTMSMTRQRNLTVSPIILIYKPSGFSAGPGSSMGSC
jgi:hypothetical protein